MLADRRLYKNIDEIVDKAYLGLLFALVGDALMSDEDKIKVEQLGLILGQRAVIELLYVLLRNRPDNGYPKNSSISSLLDQARLRTLPILNDAQQGTLDTAKAAFTDVIETSREELKKQLRQKLVDANRKHRQVVAVNRVTSPEQVQERLQAEKQELLNYIPIIMASVASQFERGFTTTLTHVVNDAILDNATSDSLFTGEAPKDQLVYKTVISDARLCQWCRRFYTNADGTPKLYKLSELQANGSNFGKKKRDWLPTVGPTHPRCRCQLHVHKPKKKA
jgi:hypothetical protein